MKTWWNTSYFNWCFTEFQSHPTDPNGALWLAYDETLVTKTWWNTSFSTGFVEFQSSTWPKWGTLVGLWRHELLMSLRMPDNISPQKTIPVLVDVHNKLSGCWKKFASQNSIASLNTALTQITFIVVSRASKNRWSNDTLNLQVSWSLPEVRNNLTLGQSSAEKFSFKIRYSQN